MNQPPQAGGYIKLWRSTSDNGHLQMPDQCWKLLSFLLLNVNHKAMAGCQSGEGWITYRMIREGCCDPARPQWADSTINRALNYLEGNNPRGEKYLQRVHTHKGGPQRIRILNWRKYQSESTSVPQEVALEVALEVPQEVALEKQEEIRMLRKEKDNEEEARKTLTTEMTRLRLWIQGNCDKALMPPLIGSKFEQFLAAGFPIETIQLAVEEATNQGHGDKPAYVFTILGDWKRAKAFSVEAAQALLDAFIAKKGQRKTDAAKPSAGPAPVGLQNNEDLYSTIKANAPGVRRQ